jgi:hypothetical protein
MNSTMPERTAGEAQHRARAAPRHFPEQHRAHDGSVAEFDL